MNIHLNMGIKNVYQIFLRYILLLCDLSLPYYYYLEYLYLSVIVLNVSINTATNHSSWVMWHNTHDTPCFKNDGLYITHYGSTAFPVLWPHSAVRPMGFLPDT